jgi:hypothetical protein
MDAKTLDLTLLAALSLLCAIFAWAGDVMLLARSFLRSVQSRLSAQPMGSGVEGDGSIR